MNSPGVGDEVLARPRVPGKKFCRQQVSLQAIARAAGENDVARRVRAAVSQRVHMVEGREVELQRQATIDAASAAIAHSGSFDCSFLVARGNFLGPAADTRSAGEGDTMEVPTS